ncbi:SDR family oxidoreductase [Psychrobacter aquimaris]|uniref:SDR family oxidoreductase n=1 Tax=Psychrobacter aquimaris TaxID=292733 RepID=UPI0039C5E05A
MNNLNRIVIFGATSAIAEHTARQLVQNGASVYCIGRNTNKLNRIIADLKVRSVNNQVVDGINADLADTAQHPILIEQAIKSLGGLDAVLIAYGTLPDQRACEADAELTQKEIQINALSVINLLTLLANYFETQGKGVIATISSVAGDRGRQSNYVYGAAKGMVSLFLQGLRNRLMAKGVSVVTIKPGFVDSPMTADFDKSGPLWVKPEVIATGIIKAMQKGKNEVYLPWFWWGIMQIIKHIPEAIFKRLSL